MFTSRIFRQALAGTREVVQGSKSGINHHNINLSNSAIAQVSIAIKAGTRFEIEDNVSQTLALCRSNTSESHTEYLQKQSLERAGADWSAEVTREHIIYTLKCGPAIAHETFSNVVLPGLFCSKDWIWEVREKEQYQKNILSRISKEDRLFDQLHSNCFKGGLSRSTAPILSRIGSGWMRKTDWSIESAQYKATPMLYDQRVSVGEVASFRDLTFVHDNITIFTSGFEEDEAQTILDSVAAYTSSGGEMVAEKETFISSETRIPTDIDQTSNQGSEPNPRAHEASGWVGFPGVAAGARDALAYDILAAACDGRSANYSDNGLFAIKHNGDAKKRIAAMANVSDDDINWARESLSNSHAFECNTFNGAVKNIINKSYLADYTNVSNADVKSLGQSLAKGPKSLIVEGRLSGTDFLSEC